MHFEDRKEDNDVIPGEAIVQTITLLAPGGGWTTHYPYALHKILYYTHFT